MFTRQNAASKNVSPGADRSPTPFLRHLMDNTSSVRKALHFHTEVNSNYIIKQVFMISRRQRSSKTSKHETGWEIIKTLCCSLPICLLYDAFYG